MSKMLKSSGAMAAATMASRILGMVRDQVFAAFMSTSAVAGAFMFAFTFPNLFRRLLGEGALTAAFIPIFKAKEKTEGEVEMWKSANAVISGLIVTASIIVAVAMLVVTIILMTTSFPANTELMLRLSRIMFPYMLLVCLAAVFIGMLNARGHFFMPALGAAMLNVVMIASVLFLAPKWGKTLDTQIFALAYGVLVAGVAQAAFQLPTLFAEGFRFKWITPWNDPTVREVVRKMLPASVGVAAFQLNVTITQAMAFGKYEPIVAIFAFAVRFMELPQGVFGISLATYLLPTLSGFAAEKNYTEFRNTLRQGVSYLIFINALSSVLLFVLAEPIIRLVFQYKKFGPHSTATVSAALTFLAPGLIAFSLVNIMARAFYALGDVKTPMRISVASMTVNLILAAMFLFVLDLGAQGLGLANTLSAILNFSLLSFALRKALKTLAWAELRSQIFGVAAAGVIAGFVASYLSSTWYLHFGHEKVWQRLGEVFVPMTAASLAYFGVTMWLGIPSAWDVFHLVVRKLPFIRSRGESGN